MSLVKPWKPNIAQLCNALDLYDPFECTNPELGMARAFEYLLSEYLLSAPVAEQQEPEAALDRPSDEREALRAGQAKAVMPLIGPLLDAVEGIPNDLRDELVDVLRISGQINTAMEQAAPVAVPPLTDEQIDKAIIDALTEVRSPKLWQALTHESGPYSIDVANHDTRRFARAVLSRTIPAHRKETT